MSSLPTAIADSATMLRRDVRRMQRYPSLTLMLIGLPVVFLLLFVYVFGNTLGDGLGAPAGGRKEYLDYIAPAILLLAIAGAVQGTAIVVAMDMTQGIIARFRTMAISRSSVLVGHVLGSLIQTAICIVVVLGVALLAGYRPSAGPADWLGVAGILLVTSLALIWLSVALGLNASSVETASNSPLVLTFLPFLGSGFVPTDSMPVGLRWFAMYQPFTPITDTLRDLLGGSPAGSSAILAVGWCLLIGFGGFFWSMALYRRDPVPRGGR
jgi:ABC-2 type transport system permease protein